ncbi:MAG: hypothetical protein GXO26_05580 [Crenarchaeota archaeon]|nr:hypothetical protein [Thermoproteota archaeon]
MSGKLDRFIILILQVAISTISAVLLSYLVMLVPLLKLFTYVAEYSIGLMINPFIASLMFFLVIFLTYSLASRTCRLGPLVCTIMCIVVLVFISPVTYLIVLKIESVSKTLASILGTFIHGFYIPSRDMIYVSILCAISTLMLILSRVVENSYAISELALMKRVPVKGSFSNIVLTSALILISLAFIVVGALMSTIRSVFSIPVSISLISIGSICLLLMIVLLIRGKV